MTTCRAHSITGVRGHSSRLRKQPLRTACFKGSPAVGPTLPGSKDALESEASRRVVGVPGRRVAEFGTGCRRRTTCFDLVNTVLVSWLPARIQGMPAVGQRCRTRRSCSRIGCGRRCPSSGRHRCATPTADRVPANSPGATLHAWARGGLVVPTSCWVSGMTAKEKEGENRATGRDRRMWSWSEAPWAGAAAHWPW